MKTILFSILIILCFTCAALKAQDVKANKVQLKEVQIKSQAPVLKYNPNGNIEINVANTILASSSSMMEIMSRSPNIVITDGQISVIGKGDAVIYLNGKQITYERMTAIPASQIAKIEIISNPSSKYDAEGKAVINIITKINTEEGTIGSLSQQVTVSRFAGANANSLLDFSYMKGKLSLTGNYSLLIGKTRELLYTTRTRLAEEDALRSELTTDWRRKMNNFSNYGAGAQYHFDQKNNISLAYNGSRENLGGSQDSKNNIFTNQNESFYTSGIAKKDIRQNHSVLVNYNKTIDTLGSLLFLGSQYSNFTTNANDFINENSMINELHAFRFLKNDVHQQIKISSTQADYTKAFSTAQKLEFGAKFSYAQTASQTSFLIAENGDEFKADPVLSSAFNYVEKVPAGYVNYSGVIHDRLNIGLGVRGEWTNYRLNTTVNAGQVIEDHYFNLFPNLSMYTNLGSLKVRASYTSKITRPRYQSLNPFVIYQDPFTTIEGNPNLIPEKTHSFELGANYKKFDFRVGYNYTLDPLSSAALRGTGKNSYVLKAINLDKDHTWFASVSRSLNTDWWTSVNTVNLNYSKSIDHKFSFVQVTPKPQLYLYSSNTFNINDLFKIQLLAWYLGQRDYGLYHNESRSTITMGIEKDFFKNALKFNFTANDIFHRTNAAGTYGVGQTDIYFNRTYNTSYLRFIATYSFGKAKQPAYKNKETGKTENSRAN